jgi:hypothetical protein
MGLGAISFEKALISEINRRCPKPQQVQSGECSNVAKDRCSSHDQEDGSRWAVVGGALVWVNW